ncbi:MAG: substrate-binding domain-containing protein [bacterium]
MTSRQPLGTRLRVVLDRNGVWIDELISLLDHVLGGGSINAAGRATGMGYRRAWQVLHDAAELFGVPLIESQVGGAAGGGSIPTSQARRLREHLATLQSELESELSRVIGEARSRAIAGGEGAREGGDVTGAATRPPVDLPRPADILLATSMEPVESGLLDALEQRFAEETGHHIRHIATGSGEALAMVLATRADLALSHAPYAETSLLERGKLAVRQPIMASSFVLACSAADPLSLADREGAPRLSSLFAEIAKARVPFVTRADGSGTHWRELEIWEELEICPSEESWYYRAGEPGGVGAVKQARELKGYTLADEMLLRRIGGPFCTTAEDSFSRNVYSLVAAVEDPDPKTPVSRLLAWTRGSALAGLCERHGVEAVT